MRNFTKDFPKTADIINSMKLRQYWVSLIFFIGIIANVFSEIHIYFFDVGQGNCILLRNEEHAILVDAGGSKRFDEIAENFKACLGESKIDGMILTHQDTDHTKYVDTILSSDDKLMGDTYFIFSVKPSISKTDLPSVIFAENCKTFRDFSTKSPAVEIEDIQQKLNDLFKEGEFKFLKANWTSANKETNDTCLVFSFKYQGFKVLFTGDSTGEALDNYIEQGSTNFPGNPHSAYNREIIANTHIFVIPHHGSDTRGSWRWTLNVVKNSPCLLATIISANPSIQGYYHPQSWLVDISWPKSMSFLCEKHKFYYKRGTDTRELDINERMFTTGLSGDSEPYIEIMIQEGTITMPNTEHPVRLEEICEFQSPVVSRTSSPGTPPSPSPKIPKK